MLQAARPFRYEQAQALLNSLGQSMALVEMFVDAEEIVAFTLRSHEGQPTVARMPMPSSSLASILQAYYREVVEYPHHGDTGQSWQDYVRPVLTAVIPKLEEAASLYLVPHGPLRYLPFHCVETDGGCLIDRFPIAYSTSLPLLEHVMERSQGRERREPPQALVVGNPTLDLDHAEAEARHVAARFQTEPLIGKRATKVAVRSALATKDLVHLACHSFHHAWSPMQSGMLYAGRRVLTAEEIIGAGLQADLVVLSACESGLQTEEQGLPTVFLEAGASAVLASLWFVDDEATGEFLLDFYSNLYNSAGHRIEATAKALQLAMLAMRKRREHPYYWAAFELIGAWK
jgi:CHAT domain-containing protein